MKNGVIIILMILLIICIPQTYYSESDIEEAMDTGYSDGHTAGYNEGYKVGHDEGYDKGYDNGYADGCSEGSSEYVSVDELPAEAVYITPTGEKYHASWCQYVVGKTNLTYFENADEALVYGYYPCSVCQ